jgi:hypothetical protein
MKLDVHDVNVVGNRSVMGEQTSRTAFGRRQATVGFPITSLRDGVARRGSRRDRGGAPPQARELGELRFTRTAVAWEFAIFRRARRENKTKPEMKNRVWLEASSDPVIA